MCNTVTPADVQVIMHVCVCMCTLVFWNVDFFSPKAELRKMFAQGTLFNLMWQLRGKGSLGENGYMVCMAEALCCPPETITAWSISYTPI